MTETVPKEDLEALVEEWNKPENHRKRAYECADELAELIDDE